MSRTQHLLRAVLASSFLVTTLLLAAGPAAAVDGSSFVTEVNRYRAAAGIATVTLDASVDRVAVERANQLAQAREIGHDLAYVQRRFAELGVCWEGMGEIVAWSSSSEPAGFVRQWNSSPLHHDIMLTPAFTSVGGSWARGGDGRYYAAMLFVDPCGQAPTAGLLAGFSDIGSSAFRYDIAWLVDAGITAGCAVERYCPRASVTREQMASFLERTTGTPNARWDWFRDDNASTHEGDINSVAAAGITRGCDSGMFCPHAGVTRGQMASFLARALDLPAAGRDWFGDDQDSIHQAAINQLADAGITGGCAADRFCPDAMVTREQMAGLLHRAFGG